MGFTPRQRERILAEAQTLQSFEREFSYFERAKVSGCVRKVADGVNHPALFNMRTILKFMPEYCIKNGIDSELIPETQFFDHLLSQFAKRSDTRLRTKHRAHIQNFQRLYRRLLVIASGSSKPAYILPGILERSRELNRGHRVTGNALIQIVNELLLQLKKGMPHSDCQKIIDQLVHSYVGLPETDNGKFYQRSPRLVTRPDIFAKIMNIIEEHQEDI